MTSTDQKQAKKPTDDERGISAEDRRERDREAAEGPLPRPSDAQSAGAKNEKK